MDLVKRWVELEGLINKANNGKLFCDGQPLEVAAFSGNATLAFHVLKEIEVPLQKAIGYFGGKRVSVISEEEGLLKLIETMIHNVEENLKHVDDKILKDLGTINRLIAEGSESSLQPAALSLRNIIFHLDQKLCLFKPGSYDGLDCEKKKECNRVILYLRYFGMDKKTADTVIRLIYEYGSKAKRKAEKDEIITITLLAYKLLMDIQKLSSFKPLYSCSECVALLENDGICEDCLENKKKIYDAIGR